MFHKQNLIQSFKSEETCFPEGYPSFHSCTRNNMDKLKERKKFRFFGWHGLKIMHELLKFPFSLLKRDKKRKGNKRWNRGDN